MQNKRRGETPTTTVTTNILVLHLILRLFFVLFLFRKKYIYIFVVVYTYLKKFNFILESSSCTIKVECFYLKDGHSLIRLTIINGPLLCDE